MFKLKKHTVLTGTTILLLSLTTFSSSAFLQESFAQYAGNVGSDDSDVKATASHPPPLRQLKDGFSPKDITCNEGLELLIKNNGIPICVTSSTKVILMERFGWTKPEISSLNTTDQDKTSTEKFPYKIGKEIFANDLSSSSTDEEMIKFSSPSEIFDFLKDAQKIREDIRQFNAVDLWVSSEEQSSSGGYRGNLGEGSYTLEEALELQRRSIESGPAHGGAVSFDEDYGGKIDYSNTNTQVDFVDEPDYIKTDGRYIYLVNQNTLTIIDAYPAETANILHKVALDIEPQDLENIFLHEDKLTIIYQGSAQPQILPQGNEFDSGIFPYPIYNSNTVVSILDISDRENPQLLSEYEIDGDYHDSRMIGNIVYLIADSYADYNTPIIPRIISESGETVFIPDVYRFSNPEDRYNFNTIAAIDISANSLANSETFLMGDSNTIYVSENNIYITYQKNITPRAIEDIQREIFFDNILPLLPQVTQEQIRSIYDDSGLTPSQKQVQISEIIQQAYNILPKQDREELFEKMQDTVKDFEFQIQRDLRQTAIHKIALDDGNLTYVANASVPGHLLNQFSMDENNGKFRVTTTSENNFRDWNFDNDGTSNNVYVLDENLNQIGDLEDIAPGEKVYSARFMGDQLYLVTFKQVDPFFVIDLSENTPKILGELKIPGFSNYLQAYDDTHIIGIGRDTIESKNGGVQTEGIKISMFDVSDFENPKEKDTIIIGDSSTESDILYSHKAFLLDKTKDIMSIPIKTNIASTLDDEMPVQDEDYYHYDRYWNGFYIYGFDQDGFVEKGTITHYQYQDHYNLPYMQPRSFYIEDALYTVMDGNIKINDINNIQNELNSINLVNTGKLIEFVK